MALFRQLLGVPKAASVGKRKRRFAFSIPFLYAWGRGTSGQLGLGNTTNYSSPKQIGSSTINWADSFGMGSSASAALKTDGTLWAWGSNSQGQLGQGNTTSYSSPKQVGALTDWSKVVMCGSATFAIKTNGTLWSWGANSVGQLGQNNTTYYSSPKQVGALSTWLTLVGGGYCTGAIFAIKTDGTLWGWGNNNNGRLGLGNAVDRSSPVQVGSLTNWLNVSSGYNYTLAVKTDGTLWGWGENAGAYRGGSLGLGNATNYSSPKQVGSLTNWLSVTAGAYYAIGAAIKTDGTLWTWGNGYNGLLGLGNTTNFNSPKQVGFLTDWAIVSTCNVGFCAAVKTNGTLWSWGAGDIGTLGLGNLTNYSSPKQVGSATNWVNVHATDQYSAIALTS